MNKRTVLEELRQELGKLGGSDSTIGIMPDCPSSDIVLRTPCYFAFFVLEEDSRGLRDRHRKAQAEIVSANGNKDITWPRDINLVFLISSEKTPDESIRRELLDDRHGCRKFIVSVNGNIAGALAALPFGPSDDLFRGDSVAVASGVQEAVRGYDPQLIADLGSRSPGAGRIVENIREGAYHRTAPESASSSSSPARVLRPSQSKLKSIDITDFRGIRHLSQSEMPLGGDVVFIYGPNGVGKTSIADAVEWAISGQVHRLAVHADEIDPVANIFSTGETRVICEFSDRESITRIKRGTETERLIGTQFASDDRVVIDHVVGTEAPSTEVRLRLGRLRDLFRGSHLLSQHDIRKFLEEIDPKQRFDILTNMIGADEFVRFREKIATVLKHLRSHGAELAEHAQARMRRLEELATRIQDRRNDVQQLRGLLTGTQSLEQLIGEILSGLKRCECDIKSDIVGDSGLDTVTQDPQLLSLRADSAIRSKRSALNELLLGLRDLESGYAGYTEAHSRVQQLRTEIITARDTSKKLADELQAREGTRLETQTRIRELQEQQADSARTFSNIAWIAENRPRIFKLREMTASRQPLLERLRADLEKAETGHEQLRQRLEKSQRKKEELQKQADELKAKGDRARAILGQLPSIRSRQETQRKALQRSKAIETALKKLRQKANVGRNAISAVGQKLKNFQSAYDNEAARNDSLSGFLAQIGELIRSAECPLCGRGYDSLEEAKSQISEHLHSLPGHLKDMARKVDETKKEIAAKQEDLDSVSSEIQSLESEAREVSAIQLAGVEEIDSFVMECADLGIDLAETGPDSWQATIEGALDSLSPALALERLKVAKDQSQKLVASVSEAMEALRLTKQKLQQEENEHRRLVDELNQLEGDIVGRGFNPQEIPSMESVRATRQKNETTIKATAESLAASEKSLSLLESEIASRRNALNELKEDEAVKGRQLQEFEATCNRYLNLCSTWEVDPENLLDSVSGRRKRADEFVRALTQLEERRKILEQVAGLKKLESEVADLVQAQNQQKQEVEAAAKAQTEWNGWISRIEALHGDVTRGQMDVVSSHLERLEPTAQRLYQRMSPHPLFGNVKIFADEETRKLEVRAATSLENDRLRDVTVAPSAFFSDAQLNSLAITLFLAGALRQRWSGLSSIIIDDPVQQMDEMNVYAFLDLVRGLSANRQFIVFTCSRDFYLLALEKLDCLNKLKRGSFLAYRLEGVAPSKLRVHCDSEREKVREMSDESEPPSRVAEAPGDIGLNPMARPIPERPGAEPPEHPYHEPPEISRHPDDPPAPFLDEEHHEPTEIPGHPDDPPAPFLDEEHHEPTEIPGHPDKSAPRPEVPPGGLSPAPEPHFPPMPEDVEEERAQSEDKDS